VGRVLQGRHASLRLCAALRSAALATQTYPHLHLAWRENDCSDNDQALENFSLIRLTPSQSGVLSNPAALGNRSGRKIYTRSKIIMARRGTATAVAEKEEAVTKVTDAPAEEVTEAETVDTETAEEEAEVINLTDFWAAVDSVTTSVDEDGNDTTDYSGVTAVYAELSRKGKAAATREMSAKMQEEIEDGNFERAQLLLKINKNKAGEKPKGERKPRTPVDPTEEFVSRMAAFQLAHSILRDEAPEGISEDWADKVKALRDDASTVAQIAAYREWNASADENKGDAPEVHPAVELAFKLASGRVRKPYGARHNVANHIEQVFAELESGTFLTANEIAAKPSSEYGEDGATAAAVLAKLKSGKLSSPFVSVEERDGKLGAVRA
jgi:hypothetical protein